LALSLVDPLGNRQEGFIRLHELYSLRLRADLTVLSACETAAGLKIPGEGIVSLVGGFFHSGSPRVVGTLWSVEDQSTAALMTHFYRALLEQKQRPSAALRQAQIAMLHSENKLWRRPYFWAGFAFYGDWST
jgi:CHAT domain-containing protein